MTLQYLEALKALGAARRRSSSSRSSSRSCYQPLVGYLAKSANDDGPAAA